MIPTSVFSLLRPVRLARVFPGLLAAAALTLPAARSAWAQAPGSVDPGFTPTTVAATVYALLFELNPVPPPKDNGFGNVVLAGGDGGFLSTDLQPSGVGKGSFAQPIYGAANRIVFTAVQERLPTPVTGNGFQRVLLGGLFGQSIFQQAAKTPAQNIVRIFADGTQDTSFFTGTSSNALVTALLPLTNGTIVAGGQFTTFNGEPRLRIVRLLNNGLIDEAFNNSSQIDSDVLALAESITPNSGGVADGKVLVAGDFNHVSGLPVTKLARLNADGSLDQSFRPAIDTRVIAVVVQPNGKIIIGGEFTNVNGTAVGHLARLNYDGSLDTSFTAGVSGLPAGESNPVAVYVLTQTRGYVQNFNSDGTPVVVNGSYTYTAVPSIPGKIYVGGNFMQLNGLTRRYIGLLNPNGTVGGFDPGTAIYDKVQSITVQTNNGRVLVGETLGPKIGKNFVPTYLRLFGGTPF